MTRSKHYASLPRETTTTPPTAAVTDLLRERVLQLNAHAYRTAYPTH